MPRLSDTMEEGTIARWLKKAGDQIKKGDVIAEIETDKATMPLEAYENGTLEEITVEEGATVPIGQMVARIGSGASGASKPAAAAPAAEKPAEAPKAADAAPAAAPAVTTSAPSAQVEAEEPGANGTDKVRASPLARRIAQDNSIDLHSVEGSGPAGRVVRADVEAAIENKSVAPAAAASTATPAQTGPDDETVRLSQMRKTIARRMIQSMNNPQFTVTMAIDVTELVDIRNRLEISLKAVGDDTVLSINHVILRASALALRKVPEVNVSYTEDALIKHNRVNVGFAVAIPNGLVVPVVKDTDKKSIFEIARETNALVVKARAGKIEPSDYSGGTFSVSNLGMFGVEEFQGIINPPESAILAVGAAGPEPVVIDGQIVIRERMRVTLSSDHRAVDGAIAARWLQALKQYLENPLLLVL